LTVAVSPVTVSDAEPLPVGGGAVAAVDGGKAMGFRSQLMELIRAEMLRIIC
jgi:hypothetical protein